MLNGIHLPNKTPISHEALAVIRAGHFASAKAMHYHTPEDIRRVRVVNPNMHFLGRLPDSVRPDGSIYGWEEYTDICVEVIKRGVAQCVTDFQAENEPNLQPAWAGKHWEWQWFWGMVVDAIRWRVNDPRLRLGIAPLAWNPATWKDIEAGWLFAMRRVVSKFDAVCVNSYWQYAKYVTDPGFGGGASYWHAQLDGGKPVWVTEWGCSIGDVTPRPTQAVIEAAFLRDYPVWLRWARQQAYIEYAHCYISPGSTEDWERFEVSERVASAMAA